MSTTESDLKAVLLLADTFRRMRKLRDDLPEFLRSVRTRDDMLKLRALSTTWSKLAGEMDARRLESFDGSALVEALRKAGERARDAGRE